MHTTESAIVNRETAQRYRMHFRNIAVRRHFGDEAEWYIARFTDAGCPATEVIATSTPFNVEAMNGKAVNTIVNLKRVNDIGGINEFFLTVHRKLPMGGRYIGCVETLEQRKHRIMMKFPRPVAYLYYLCDFALKRVFPKLGPTRKIYTLLTRGNNRALSLTETLGRLSACGFSVENHEANGKLTYFTVRKNGHPKVNSDIPYGVLLRLRRIGKDGNFFNVFKLRTMHPYAEYLQDYVHKNNNLGNGGKFNKDFRVTSWGRFMRKLWIDEQPMWINWLRGEMKLVGVRPLSEQYFNLYPEDFRSRRMKYKPGLIPPFYVDLPESLDEIIESERRYLDAYDRHPRLTDTRYFWRVVFNILVKRARSA